MQRQVGLRSASRAAGGAARAGALALQPALGCATATAHSWRRPTRFSNNANGANRKSISTAAMRRQAEVAASGIAQHLHVLGAAAPRTREFNHGVQMLSPV